MSLAPRLLADPAYLARGIYIDRRRVVAVLLEHVGPPLCGAMDHDSGPMGLELRPELIGIPDVAADHARVRIVASAGEAQPLASNVRNTWRPSRPVAPVMRTFWPPKSCWRSACLVWLGILCGQLSDESEDMETIEGPLLRWTRLRFLSGALVSQNDLIQYGLSQNGYGV